MKRRRKTSKTKASKIHFHMRSLERVGFLLNENDIIYQIQHPEEVRYNMTHVRKCSNRVSKWELIINEKVFIIIYDKIRKCLVTIYQKAQQPNSEAAS